MMLGMRTALARGLAVLACLVLPFALVSAWLDQVVTDTDTYVETVGPLADDPVVQRAAAGRIEQSTARLVEEQTGISLGTIPRRLIRDAALTVVTGPAFGPAWREANRSAHREFVDVMQGDSDSVRERDGVVSLELGTLLNTLLGIVADQGLLPGITLPEVQVSFVLLEADALDNTRTSYDALEAAGLWLPALWVVLALAALVLSGDRRRVLGTLGYGSLGMLALLAVALVLLREAAIDSAATAVDATLLEAILGTLLESLFVTVGAAAAVAVVVLVARRVLSRARPASP